MEPSKRVKKTACSSSKTNLNQGIDGMMVDRAAPTVAPETRPETETLAAESVIAVCTDHNLLKTIFHCLEIRDLCSASSVCRLWNQVGSSEDFWKEVSFKDKVVYPHQVAALLSRHRCVQVLDLSGLTCGLHDAGLLSRIAPCLPHLTQLSFTAGACVAECHTMEHVLSIISAQLPALKSLHLHGVLLTGLPTGSSAVTHPGVSSLSFTGCDPLTSSLRCSSLKRLSLANSNIQRLPGLLACSTLVSLDVRGCKKLQDSSIRVALSGLTGLQELTLGQGVPVTDDTVREMATILTSLTKLVLSETPGLALNSVRDFPVLRVLDLCRCESLTPAALQPAAESCGQLEVLLLDGCHMLSSLKLTMPHLQEISLRGCVALADLELNCWRLAVLGLGPMQRGAPGNSTLQRLSLSSGAIKKMEWVQCRKLSQLDLKCPYLTELTIRDCDNITPAALEALGDKGPPPAAAPSLLAGPSAAAGAAVEATGGGLTSLAGGLTGLMGPGSLADAAAARRTGGAAANSSAAAAAAGGGLGSGERFAAGVAGFGSGLAEWQAMDEAEWQAMDAFGEAFGGLQEPGSALAAAALDGDDEDQAGPDGAARPDSRQPGQARAAGPRGLGSSSRAPREAEWFDSTDEASDSDDDVEGFRGMVGWQGARASAVRRHSSRVAAEAAWMGPSSRARGGSGWSSAAAATSAAAGEPRSSERSRGVHNGSTASEQHRQQQAEPSSSFRAAARTEASPSTRSQQQQQQQQQPCPAPPAAAGPLLLNASRTSRAAAAAAAEVAAPGSVDSRTRTRASSGRASSRRGSAAAAGSGSGPSSGSRVRGMPRDSAAAAGAAAAAVFGVGEMEEAGAPDSGLARWIRGIAAGHPDLELAAAAPAQAAAAAQAEGSDRVEAGAHPAQEPVAAAAAAPAAAMPEPWGAVVAHSDGEISGMSEDDMPPPAQQQQQSPASHATPVASAGANQRQDELPVARQTRACVRSLRNHPGPVASQQQQRPPGGTSSRAGSSSRSGRPSGRLFSSLPSLCLPRWAGGAAASSSSSSAAAAGASASGSALPSLGWVGPRASAVEQAQTGHWHRVREQMHDHHQQQQQATVQQPQQQQGEAGTAAAAAAAPSTTVFIAGGFGPGGGGMMNGHGIGNAGPNGGGGGPPVPLPPPRPPVPCGGGGGGLPALRVLRVEGCDGLKRLSLRHSGLQVLGVSGCRSLGQLVVAAPKLADLELDEVGELSAISLQEVGLPSLSLGSCSGLSGLELSSSSLARLDLRGCGQLTQLLLDCPTLSVMDATFCSELGDTGLAGAVANAPPLTQLVLSVCCQVGSTGLASLSCLSTLQELDLSYTEVTDLAPVFSSCPQLRTLSLSSCGSLAKDALAPLLRQEHPALPRLVSLDASYCCLNEQLVARLLSSCTRLEHLALNGCVGVTDALWQELETAQLAALAAQQLGQGGVFDLDVQVASSSSKLRSLSLVRCSNLKSLCLGLLPATGWVEVLQPKHYLLSADRAALHARQASYGWVEVPSAVAGLTSLRVGLSGVQVVALALAHLAHLDVSSCSYLRVMELRCPLLLTLHLQACRALPMYGILQAAVSCPALVQLDVQHVLTGGAACSNGSSRKRSATGDHDGCCDAAEGMEEVVVGDGAASSGCRDAAGGGRLAAAVKAHPTAFGAAGGAAELHELLDELAAGHPSLQQVLRCPVGCAVCTRAVI